MNLDLEFYQKILEASHDEICVSDDKGIIIYCNKAFEENYGLKKKIFWEKCFFFRRLWIFNKKPHTNCIKNKD